MVPGGIARAVGGLKGNGFSQVVGPAPDRGKLFWFGAVRRRVRTLGRDVLFFGAFLPIPSCWGPLEEIYEVIQICPISLKGLNHVGGVYQGPKTGSLRARNA